MGRAASIPTPGLPQDARPQSGTFSVPFENVIWSAGAGVAETGGTFEELIIVPELERGVVRTTWLGGIAAPVLRWAYIRSSDWMT